MEYTIKKLGEMAGVSVRTLRYYDEIGLLKPGRINAAGYRIYGEKEVDLLQQILFYKAMDFRLEEIQKIMSDEAFDVAQALVKHRERLIEKQQQIEGLIKLVDKTIAHNQGEKEMTDMEKFEAFKRGKLEENEVEYGKEIRENYGEEAVDKANHKFMGLTQEAFNEMEKTENEMIEALKKVVASRDLESEEARFVYEKHKAWLGYTLPRYSKQMHIGLAEMYVADERFAQYYKNKVGTDCAKLLCEIIRKYAV